MKTCETGFHGVFHIFYQEPTLGFAYDLGAYFSVTSQQAPVQQSIPTVPPPLPPSNALLLAGTHVARLAADEGLVNFDFAGEFPTVPSSCIASLTL
jgi:hypothetical protein